MTHLINEENGVGKEKRDNHDEHRYRQSSKSRCDPQASGSPYPLCIKLFHNTKAFHFHLL